MPELSSQPPSRRGMFSNRPSSRLLYLLDVLISHLSISAATLKSVEGDLIGVKAAIKSEPSIHDFLGNPVLSHEVRSAGIDELLKKASPKSGPSEMTKNFFEVLASNGRLYEAEKVITDFLEITSAHRGEVKVTITTAQPLEKDLQKRLEETLKHSKLAGEGKTLIIENKVNEAVLGGLLVDFGDKTVDLSVASRVNQLNATLQGLSISPSFRHDDELTFNLFRIPFP